MIFVLSFKEFIIILKSISCMQSKFLILISKMANFDDHIPKF